MGVKKQGLPAYDPRGVQSMGLSYATSNRGACHVRSYGIAVEILGVNQKLDPLESKGKPGVIKAFQDFTGVIDSSGLCLFVSLAEGFGVNDMVDMLEVCTGAGYTAENVLQAGERIWNMERLFNLKAGITSADDTLPPRFLKEPMPEGPAKGRVSKLDEMLPEYYSLRGWDVNGVPSPGKLSELGL